MLRQDAIWLGQLVDDQGAEPPDRDEAADVAAAGTAAGTADEGNCAGADDDDGPDTGSDEAEVAKVPGVCVEPASLLDSDVSVFWPLVAAMPTETPTATVRVPAAMRAGRFHFRGLLAGDWSLMTFSLPGAGTFRV